MTAVAGDNAFLEQQYELLVNSVLDYAIFSLDPDGVVRTWNTGAERNTGYAASEIIGRHFSCFYSPEGLAEGAPAAELEAAARGGRHVVEGLRVRKDGTRYWAHVVTSRLVDPEDGSLRGFAQVTRDLTQWRAREEALRENEEALAATLYSIGDGVIATDEQGRVTRLNPVAEQLTGWTQRDAVGRPVTEVFDIVSELTREPVESPVRRVLREGLIVGLANHTALIARDGTERAIADSGAPIRDSSGRVRGAVLVFRDITEERRAAEARHVLEERFRILVSQVSDYAIFMLDPAGNIASWNAGAERMKGYLEEEVLGRHFSLFYTEEEIASGKPQRLLEAARERGRVEDEGHRVRKNGDRFWANAVLTALRGARGELIGFAKVTRDMSELRGATARLLEERAARAASEAAQVRSAFLADLGKALAESLDLRAALQRTARLALPMLGDYCIIDLRRPDGSAELLALAHLDPSQEPLVANLRRLQAPDPATHPAPRVLRSGKSEVVNDYTDDMLVAAARSPEFLETLQRLHPTAHMIVPMIVGERPTGTISFVSTRAERRFSDVDLSLAEDLAHRTALVIENARLYAAEQEARVAAEETKRRLEAIVDQLPVGVLLTELPSGLPLLQNRELRRLFAHDPARSPALARRPPESAAGGAPPSLVLESPAGEIAPGQQLRIAGPQREERWATVNAAPIRDGSGAVVAGVATFHDVTELKRALESLELLAKAGAVLGSSLEHEATLQHLADLAVPTLADWCAVHIADEAGNIRNVAVAHADPAKVTWARQLGERYPVRPGEPRGVARVLATGQREFYPRITEELLVAGARDPEHERILRELGMTSVLIVPLSVHGRTAGVLSMINAESGRRFSDREIRLIEELARRAAIALENARLYRESQRAITLRDEFVSIASHELKTPLTSLQLHVEGLLRSAQRGEALTSDRSLAKLRAVASQVDRQERLVHELLDFSRIAAGRLEFQLEEFDLKSVVLEVAERFEADLARRGCSLELEAVNVVGTWDRLRMDQIVTNLLSNALKYAPGEPIRVRLTATDPDVTLEVVDRGPGIGAADHERIFQRFERAVSRRNYGGFGLGLWLVREIVTRLGGNVAVDSELGRGATFRVVLPRHAPVGGVHSAG